ncbi:MAG: hypothetical protein HC883_04225 [Bdellovibrionaceae bacterium]|nr:hypothetical protein [Pseudobdellovibrionaceae bacterium]
MHFYHRIQMIPSFIKVIAQRIGLLFLAYFLCRVLFLFWNSTLYAETPPALVALSFLYGLRFDLAAICSPMPCCADLDVAGRTGWQSHGFAV